VALPMAALRRAVLGARLPALLITRMKREPKNEYWEPSWNLSTIPDSLILSEAGKRNNAKRQTRSGGAVWKIHRPKYSRCRCLECIGERKEQERSSVDQIGEIVHRGSMDRIGRDVIERRKEQKRSLMDQVRKTIQLRKGGMTLTEIAALTGVGTSTVWYRLGGMPRGAQTWPSRARLPVGRPPLGRSSPHPQYQTIMELKQQGMSLRQIGLKVGLSYERVRQILNGE
jgi:hypothetical protein